MYKKEILEHYKSRQNYGTLDNPELISAVTHPSCGDKICFQAKIQNNIFTDIKFTGEGCILSIGFADLFSEYCKNKSTEFIAKLTNQDIISLIKLDLGPTRLKCILLSLESIQAGIKNI